MNREVLSLRDSAETALKLNGDYGVTLNYLTQRARGGVQGPQWLNGYYGTGCIAESTGSRFGSEFAKASRLLRTLGRIEKLAGGTRQFGGRD